MQSLLDMKVTLCLPPSAKNNDPFDGPVVPVDTQGLSELVFFIQTGALSAAIGSEDDVTALKIGECDTADGEYTDVPGAELAGPIAANKGDSVFMIRLDLRRTHKRYMAPIEPAAGDGGGLLSILAVGLPAIMPIDPVDVGCEEVVLA